MFTTILLGIVIDDDATSTTTFVAAATVCAVVGVVMCIVLVCAIAIVMRKCRGSKWGNSMGTLLCLLSFYRYHR